MPGPPHCPSRLRFPCSGLWKGNCEGCRIERDAWLDRGCPDLERSSISLDEPSSHFGCLFGTVKKKIGGQSWKEQVLRGTLPQMIPWDDAASLVAGYSSRKSWKRVMSYFGESDKMSILTSVANANGGSSKTKKTGKTGGKPWALPSNL